jgi:tetratricopeptide (TPR) repeat protein
MCRAGDRCTGRNGSDAFNKAALKAVRDWRFESAAEQKSTVLLSFVNERRQLSLSRAFFARNAKVHRSIDNGELDDAQERIEAIRKNNNLSVFELAYSFISEGRVAGERGDKVEQLRCFRRAMLNQGRWLKRENYLKLLHATVVLEMQQQDFASALRDYELLTETSTGRKIAVDLEEPIKAVRAMVESNGNIPPPYMVANMEMSIEQEARAYSGYDDTSIQPDQEGSYPSGSSSSESSTN